MGKEVNIEELKNDLNRIQEYIKECEAKEKEENKKRIEAVSLEESNGYFNVKGLKVHWGFKLLPEGFEAITLFGHIFDYREKEDLRRFLYTGTGMIMVNHERIHTLQGKSFKLGYFTFYVLYLWYWFIGLFKYGVKNNASYYKIPFEIEAYTNETDFDYNKTEWKKYIPE